jgi:hypothetical protein
MTRRRGLLSAVGVALALLAVPAGAAAAPFEPADRDWEGCSGLYDLARGTLGTDRVIAVSRLDWSEIGPNDGLLIIHPDRPVDGDRLFAFLDAGGRAAIIDDFGAGDRILGRFHIERVPPPARPLNSLRHNAELAIAEPVAQIGKVHPSVEGVEHLVTNHPTALRYGLPTTDGPTPVLAIRAIDEPDGVIALAGAVGRGGKLFAMGDPSVLINQMLRYPGNRAFATNLVRYLADDPASPAKRGRLFVVANRFSETGAFGGASTIVHGIENAASDAIQNARDFSSDGLSGPLGLVLSAVLAAAAGAWTVKHASRVHRAVVPVFSRRTPVAAQGGASGRAALLSKGPESNVLAMIELKNALEEGLAHQIGIEGWVSSTTLLDQVKAKRALDEAGIRALKGILSDMATLETRLAAGRPARLRNSDLVQAARTTFDLLAMARERCSVGTVT